MTFGKHLRIGGATLLCLVGSGTCLAMTAEEVALEKERYQAIQPEHGGDAASAAPAIAPDQNLSARELARIKELWQMQQAQDGARPLLRAPATSLDQQLASEGLLDPQALKAAQQQAWEQRPASPFLAPAVGGDYVEDRVFQQEKQRQYETWLLHHEEPAGRDAPPNSECANATLIGPGTYAFDTTEASNDAIAPCAAENTNDVWFKFVPTCNGTATISTCEATYYYDTALAVWDGCGGTNLVCNDDNCASNGLQSTLSLAVTAGTEYLIQVAGFNTSFGQGNLSLDIVCDLPANDTCNTAQLISGEGDFPFVTGGATVTTDLGCLFNDGPDVWFAWYSACAADVTFSICEDRSYDTGIGVYDTCGGTEIACNDDACSSLGSSVTLAADASTYYFVKVTGFSGQSGYGTMLVDVPNPPNDEIGTAIPLSGDSTTPYSTCGASEGPINDCAGTAYDIWYLYTADCDQSVTFTTCGADPTYDTAMALYETDGTTLIACNDDYYDGSGYPCNVQSRLDINLAFGQQVLLQVSGFAGGTGASTLFVSTSGPANDEVAGATPISGPGDHAYSTLCASEGPYNNCAGTAYDIWYLYTADCTGYVTFTTCGAIPTYDTAMALYDTDGTTELACNDDYYDGNGFPCGVQSRLDWFLQQGEQVLLQVSGFAGGTGSSTLYVSTNCGPRQPAPFTIELLPTETDDSDATISFDIVFDAVTEDIHGNPLVVDQYTFYWTNQTPWVPFPGSWSIGGISTTPGFSFSWWTGDPHGFFLVTAEDSDGQIIASSRPELIHQGNSALSSGIPLRTPGAPLNGATQGR